MFRMENREKTHTSKQATAKDALQQKYNDQKPVRFVRLITGQIAEIQEEKTKLKQKKPKPTNKTKPQLNNNKTK